MCGCGDTKKEVCVCTVCGREEVKEVKKEKQAKSCCGQPMKKKE